MRARKFGRVFLSACLLSLLLAGPAPASASPQLAGTIIEVGYSGDLQIPEEPGSGVCTLRMAILAANRDAAVGGCPAGSGIDTIRIPVGIYRLELQLEGAGEDEGLTGDLDILQSVIIEGMGRDRTIIEPSSYPSEDEMVDRIMQIHSGAVVEMRNLQIHNANLAVPGASIADLSGGGISNAGSLRLENFFFIENHAAGNGGAIYSTGELQITDTRFINNSVDQNGGAISNSGTLTLLRDYFSGNSGPSGGAIVNAAGAQAMITETDFINNSDWGEAGAIIQMGQMTLRDCEFWINTSGDGAAALHTTGNLLVEDCLFNQNVADYMGTATIYQTAGRLTIRRSKFIDNESVNGGAVTVGSGEGTRVEDSLFLDNDAYNGSAIYAWVGKVAILNSTFQGNSGYGASVYVGGPNVCISGCTFNNNSSDYEGASAIQINSGEDVLIENSTFSRNSSQDQGAVGIWLGSATLANTTVYKNEGIGVFTGGGTITIKSSLIAENTNHRNIDKGEDCGTTEDPPTGIFVSQGYNFLGTTADCPWTAAAGDVVGSATERLDPRLADLADNGGPTQTHALLPDSPAIDAGGPACLATDQRGVPRPQGAACDIGAYEVAAEQQELGNLFFLPIIRR